MPFGLALGWFAVLALREMLSPGVVLRGESAGWDVARGALVTAAAFAAPGVLIVAALRSAVRALDAGDPGGLATGDRALAVARWIATPIFALCVFAGGWLDAVRGVMGNVIVLDEAVALAPPTLFMAVIWRAQYGIDHRVREALLMRRLDDPAEGGTIALPSGSEHVLERLRHGVLVVLAPALALTAAWETLARVPVWTGVPIGEATATALQVGVSLVALALMPELVRVLWRTAPLGAGPLRDGLVEMLRRHRVSCRRLLVWRTDDGMINGAMVGLVPWWRMILLTDGLLERVPADQVLAVMAHEVAHARRRHLPWLLGAVVSTAGVCGLASTWLWSLAAAPGLPAGAQDARSSVIGVVLVVAVAAPTVLVFGVVSRVFERQADAFAAADRSAAEGSAVVTEEGAGAMARALGSVSRLNGVPRDRPTFRHGSISGRQRLLMSLVGRPIDGMPIDGLAAVVKVSIACGVCVLAAMLSADLVL